eukprot:CAMPEP_0119038054 /NCGR_PEP_ID=MMETSP1177-20130426/6737_1 /TAXON_ID=2985 /ORGANISM="Ochromonas sp, Strain CCMP1899" /LENGTH=432 /DNA_ID=CAMNT_0007000125 /DNA_START=189 /DNA_END=1487 /DNA_ORIENTATION=-
MYSPKGDVIVGNDKNFKEEVLKSSGIVIVEFFAPWCGHCKSLVPEYEKLASTLKGVVKVVAVDATESPSLQNKYKVEGFPSLKIFGQDKKSPFDYQGQRTADAMISECMKAANKLVKDRKKGPASPKPTQPPATAAGGESKARGGPKKTPGAKGGGSAVVELTDANFKALVMESTDHWLVEFYAPWCGHCKNLEPEWETAAKQLKGSVKLGKVDATIHSAIAQTYGVKGYPTIKMFQAGKKTPKSVKDYNGPRESAGIVDHALKTLDEAGVPPNIPQLTSQKVLNEQCGENGDGGGKICVIMFLPHIYDSNSKQRQIYIDTLVKIASTFRGTFSFLWSEGTAHQGIEDALQINNVYPTLAVMSAVKSVYAVQRVSWSDKNIKAFLNGVISGSERTTALPSTPIVISKIKAWDGKDASPPVEEPLDMDEIEII